MSNSNQCSTDPGRWRVRGQVWDTATVHVVARRTPGERTQQSLTPTVKKKNQHVPHVAMSSRVVECVSRFICKVFEQDTITVAQIRQCSVPQSECVWSTTNERRMIGGIIASEESSQERR